MIVYGLQRLRVVSKGFRETVDARVTGLIDCIRNGNFKECETEPDMPHDEVATAELALETSAGWVVLSCVAEKRGRQQEKPELYKVLQAAEGRASASTIGQGASARRAKLTRTSRCRRVSRSANFVLIRPTFSFAQAQCAVRTLCIKTLNASWRTHVSFEDIDTSRKLEN